MRRHHHEPGRRLCLDRHTDTLTKRRMTETNTQHQKPGDNCPTPGAGLSGSVINTSGDENHGGYLSKPQKNKFITVNDMVAMNHPQILPSL